jgi:hypothetical protein
MDTEQNMRAGMGAQEARRQAHIKFGGLERMKERTRDARMALRTLAKNRTFTAVTVLTLTVGIGATTAIFSVVQGVLITPLPYQNADRIVRVAAAAMPQTGLTEFPFSAAGYLHFINNQGSFEAFGGCSGAGRQWRVSLLGDGPPQEVTRMSLQVSALEVLQVVPQLGRLPTREDSGTLVALISHSLWVERYGADPSIGGGTIDSNARQYEVMPEGFDFPTPEIDGWTFRRLDPESRDVTEHSLHTIGRLKPGVTIEEAVADVEDLIACFDELAYNPVRLAGLFTGRAIVRPLKDELVGRARGPLLITLGTSVFVLLIACTTVANLLLIRAGSRA